MQLPAVLERLMSKIKEAASALLVPMPLPTPKAIPVRVRRRSGHR
jgi:hypothetical protein